MEATLTEESTRRERGHPRISPIDLLAAKTSAPSSNTSHRRSTAQLPRRTAPHTSPQQERRAQQYNDSCKVFTQTIDYFHLYE